MKKFLFSLVAVCLSFMASAQNHKSYNLLNVRALNTGTNGWGVTNLANLVTNIGMVYNPTNVSYTNSSGTYVGSSATYLGYINTTNTSTTASLFNDIPLFSDEVGRPIFISTLEYSVGLPTNLTYFGHMTLFVEYVNPYGSNAPWGLTLRPVWDGVTPSTSTADDWGFRIAGLSTGKGTLATNIPTYKWVGARALRVVAVTNQYILAGPAAQTNSTFITKLSANGFVP
jgi:hypothetical protein